MSDRTLRGVADRLVQEEVPDDVGTVLRRPQIGADAVDHLSAGRRAAPTEGVHLHIVIQQFVGVEFRRVRRQEEDLDLVPVSLQPPPGGGVPSLFLWEMGLAKR